MKGEGEEEVKTTILGHEHHLTHASVAFYNSGFEKAAVIVVDGAGSFKEVQMETGQVLQGFETETFWLCEYPSNFTLIHRVCSNNSGAKIHYENHDFDSAVTLTKAYEAVSHYLGFGFIEAGKTMGLAPYGKKNNLIPQIFNGNRASKDLMFPYYPAGAFIDQERISIFKRSHDPREWHYNPNKLSDIEKDLAWIVQKETQELLSSYVEKLSEVTETKNIVIVGGYGLNCVANYYLKKKFPEFNFYIEPISHDGGTSIGTAKLIWHTRKNDDELSGFDKTIRPQKTLYHGPKYEKEQLEKTLQDHSEKILQKIITHNEVAKLISEKNIVAIFQGRSEAGPRALGNRSILYDPRDPDGKNVVNKVKGREWFRPFAGSCLKEDANDWFDLAGMEESPFMMYAVNVAADKLKEIPAITHVDDTCRVQTVTEEQNEHYYKLIKSFKDITGVPILFNTSFNLAGDPLVETLDHALDTLYRSELKYLYLPELELLIEKREEKSTE
jgi:carbamoyltransferase